MLTLASLLIVATASAIATGIGLSMLQINLRHGASDFMSVARQVGLVLICAAMTVASCLAIIIFV
jgi:hypothetical protein